MTGSEIHFNLECPTTSHVELDLIQLITNILFDTCQPEWTTLATHQQTSLILGESAPTLPKKLHHIWLISTLPEILHYVSQLENLLYITLNKLSGTHKIKNLHPSSSSPQTHSTLHIENTPSFSPLTGSLELGSSAPNATILFSGGSHNIHSAVVHARV